MVMSGWLMQPPSSTRVQSGERERERERERKETGQAPEERRERKRASKREREREREEEAGQNREETGSAQSKNPSSRQAADWTKKTLRHSLRISYWYKQMALAHASISLAGTFKHHRKHKRANSCIVSPTFLGHSRRLLTSLRSALFYSNTKNSHAYKKTHTSSTECNR